MNLYNAAKAHAEDHGHPWFRGPWNLNFLGIRRPGSRATDLFDDAIVVATETPDGACVAWVYAATTDPGRAYLYRPMRADGCAIVAVGTYRGVYAIGEHKGYPALEQVGTLSVHRDANRDDVYDYGPRTSAPPSCKINVHAAADDANGPASRAVGRWSADCEVIRRRSDLRNLLTLVVRQKAQGFGGRVSYSLSQGVTRAGEFLLDVAAKDAGF